MRETHPARHPLEPFSHACISLSLASLSRQIFGFGLSCSWPLGFELRPESDLLAGAGLGAEDGRGSALPKVSRCPGFSLRLHRLSLLILTCFDRGPISWRELSLLPANNSASSVTRRGVRSYVCGSSNGHQCSSAHPTFVLTPRVQTHHVH